MIGQDHLHIIEKGAVQEQSLLVHCTLMFQSQKKHQYIPKLSGNKNILFFQAELQNNRCVPKIYYKV